MTGSESDERFVERVRQRLEDDAEHLDAATRSRLNRIRQATLDRAPSPGRLGPRLGFRWFAGAAAAAVAVLAVFFTGGPDPVDLVGGPADAAFEIAASGESPSFYEDIDFYAWLAEMDGKDG